jgi:hypothetical protein
MLGAVFLAALRCLDFRHVDEHLAGQERLPGG